MTTPRAGSAGAGDTPEERVGSDRVRELPPLIGDVSQLHVFAGSDQAPPNCPLLCASETGYSPLGGVLNGAGPPVSSIGALADWMRGTADGAFVALVDAPPAPRPLGLTQDNRGRGETANFYESRHGDAHGIWRDFYYRSVYTLIAGMDDRWGATDIELTHPTGHGWPGDLITVVLEALGQLADTRELRVERVHLACCLEDLSETETDRALMRLNREQRHASRPKHRDYAVEEFDLASSDAPSLSGATVLRIPLALGDNARSSATVPMG